MNSLAQATYDQFKNSKLSTLSQSSNQEVGSLGAEYQKSLLTMHEQLK